MNDAFENAYEQRLLVFLENDEFNGFNQVLLNPEQFKKVSDGCMKSSKPDPSLKDGFEMGILSLSGETYPPELFDGLNSINEEEKP